MGVGYLAYSATPDGRRANELLGELMIQIVWNVVIEPIMEGWYSVFAQGKPNKAVKDACRQKGIRDVNHFSDYYHERKRKNGRRGKDNNQWRVLLDIADEYLEEFWA